MDLPLRFFLDGELYLLVARRDLVSREPGFREVGRWEAERVLASALAHADAQGVLRAAFGESGGDDDPDAAQRLRSRLDEGLDQLVLLRRQRPLPTLVLAKPEAEVDLAELALEPASDDPEDTWVEVLVVDDQNQPVAGVEYEIELSDGRVQRGRTSEHGILRYEDLPNGSCKVRLLSVDGRGWDVA